MSKPASRPYSQYTRAALQLLGQLIREGRVAKSLTTTDLAARAGISRSLLHRIECGDPGCSVGAMFEVATICGVSLFEPDERSLAATLARYQEKMTLLPKSIRAVKREVKDDF